MSWMMRAPLLRTSASIPAQVRCSTWNSLRAKALIGCPRYAMCETAMDLSAKIIATLRLHMRKTGVSITRSGRLADLGIDLLDLPIIALDLEDAFDIDICYDDINQFETVNCIIERVQALLESRRQQRPAPSASNAHSGSAWLRAGLKP